MPIHPGKLIDDLRRLRRLRRLTQDDVARRTGRAVPRINEVERGKTDPRLSTLLAIARALDAELVAVPREQLAAVRQLTEVPAAAVPAGDVYDEVFVPDPPSDEPASVEPDSVEPASVEPATGGPDTAARTGSVARRA